MHLGSCRLLSNGCHIPCTRHGLRGDECARLWNFVCTSVYVSVCDVDTKLLQTVCIKYSLTKSAHRSVRLTRVTSKDDTQCTHECNSFD